MKKIMSIAAVMALLIGCSEQAKDSTDPQASTKADTIYVEGQVWTGNSQQPMAQAIAIKDSKILAVGSNDDIRALASSGTQIVSIKDKLIVPGFQDSHMHMGYNSSSTIDLAGMESVDEIQQALISHVEANPDLPWILGFGWSYSAFPNEKVHKKYIDAVVSDLPVYLTSRDGHMGFANTKALEMAKVTRDSKDPEDGRIIFDVNGEPTGEMQESAQYMVLDLVPEETAEQKYNNILVNMALAASKGITTVHEAGTPDDTVPLIERALKEDKMIVRYQVAGRTGNFDAGDPELLTKTKARIEKYNTWRDKFNSDLVNMRSIKGMLDGTIDAGTAAMFEPYHGHDHTGLPFWTQQELNQVVALYDEAGFQVLLHAIGDKAINMALNSFEHANKTNGTSDTRHRIEHAEMPKISDLPRFKELGVIVSSQPMFAHPDPTVLGNFTNMLGPERIQFADSFSLFDNAGAVQVFGSDYPVMTMDVLKGIEVAVTRMTDDGHPPGGWYPKGRISVEAALSHYTRDAAYGNFQEDRRGTLEAGKYADFVVLSRDILTIDPLQISETAVLQTVMGGRETYRSESF